MEEHACIMLLIMGILTVLKPFFLLPGPHMLLHLGESLLWLLETEFNVLTILNFKIMVLFC